MAQVVQQTTATIGVVAASYRNGLNVVIIPERGNGTARKLADAVQKGVAGLRIANPEAIAADHMTVSIAITAGRVQAGADRVKLLSRAIAAAQKIAAAGGNRIVEAAA